MAKAKWIHPPTLTVAAFVEIVQNINTFWSVKFVKKGDGSIRDMQCRTGVKKGVKGVLPPGHRKAEDARCSVLTVYDIHKIDELKNLGKTEEEQERGAFRRINLEQLISVKFEGDTYEYDQKRDLLVKV